MSTTEPTATAAAPDLRFTIRDAEDLEQHAGVDLFTIEDALENASGAQRLRLLAALVWITRRKVEPGYTLDQARDTPIAELEDVATGVVALMGGAAVDPPATDGGA